MTKAKNTGFDVDAAAWAVRESLLSEAARVDEGADDDAEAVESSAVVVETDIEKFQRLRQELIMACWTQRSWIARQSEGFTDFVDNIEFNSDLRNITSDELDGAIDIVRTLAEKYSGVVNMRWAGGDQRVRIVGECLNDLLTEVGYKCNEGGVGLVVSQVMDEVVSDKNGSLAEIWPASKKKTAEQNKNKEGDVQGEQGEAVLANTFEGASSGLDIPKGVSSRKDYRSPARAGKKTVMAYLDQDTVDLAKKLAALDSCTLQQYVSGAIERHIRERVDSDPTLKSLLAVSRSPK